MKVSFFHIWYCKLYLVKGLLWFFLVLLAETIGSLFLVLGIINQEEENSYIRFIIYLLIRQKGFI